MEKSKELKPGDIVCLKSDRIVKMTISDFEEKSGINYANCQWFDYKILIGGSFPVTSLTTDISSNGGETND